MTALALTAIAPRVAPVFGASPAWIGYQISTIYASGAVASAAAGTLVDRHGAVRIEQVALLTYVLGLALLAMGWLPAAVAGSLAIGVGYGLQNPASSHILGAITPPAQRSLVFSIKQAGVPIGGVIASLGMPLLVAVAGWRVALWLLAVPSLALIAVLAHDHAGEVHVPPPRRSLLGGFLAEQRLVWGAPTLRVLAMLGMIYSSLQLSLSAFTVNMLVEDHWTLLAAGATAGAVQAFGAAGRVFWGHVADRSRAGMAVLALIGAVSMATMLACNWLVAMPHAVAIAVLALCGFCMSGWNGVLMAEATRHCARHDTGRVIGGTLVFTFLGVTAGPASFAAVYGLTGHYGATFALAALVAGAGAVLALADARRVRQ